ncbi:MAG: hypothetical protein A2V85_03590 [Chloroflexi bacterium RBG_16_72_14]|nr:MAG: hypothetical protein A2V85_03590 [Chloroflexi bacterium RBG_16_72_14]
MIVEPVPTRPRSPLRRAAGWLGMALPPVLLVGVVAAGILGRPAEDKPAAGAATPGAAASLPAPGASTEPIATTEAGPAAADGGPAWPTVAADLAVRSVTDALVIRSRAAPDRELAVAGYLGVLTPPEGCPAETADGLGPWCERRGMLVEQPWVTSGGGVFAPIGVHFHPRFPVGVRVPDAIAGTTREAGGGPVPVVLVGRFEPDSAFCTRLGPSCEARFLVDQVAWVEGAAFPSRPVFDQGVDGSPTEWMTFHQLDAEVAAIGWSGTVLVSALLRAETLEQVDPAAARALATRRAPAGLVWYVRGLETGYDPTRYPLGQSPPRLRWIVLDDTTGEVIARGGAVERTG